MSEVLKIRMFGSLEFEKDGVVVTDAENRSKKLWLVLAYLLHNNNQRIPQSKLIDVIWNENEITTNPANALKTLFHRARQLLNPISDELGYELFLCKRSEFFTNPEYEYELDINEFISLYNKAITAETDEECFEYLYDAFKIYKGEFLEKFQSESWVIPVTIYYHNIFLRIAEDLILLCEKKNQYSDAIEICLRTLHYEKYEERFYHHLMRNLIDTDRSDEAIMVYNNLSDMLSKNFGLAPSDEIRALYQEALAYSQNNTIDLTTLQENLIEKKSNNKLGAFFCDYNLFCEFYHALSRSLERTDAVIHIAIISVTDLQGKALAKRSLSVVTNNMRKLMCESLRQGDIISLCSPSQFVLLLSNTNRESTEIILNRLEKTYLRQYPHTPAKFSHSVQPILSIKDKE